MHLQMLISILVWVTVLGFTRVVSDDDISEPQKSELTNKLNILLHYSGWRSMDSVRILVNRNHRREIADPMSEILEVLSAGRKPIDEFNVLEKYTEIWTVLRCKYADIMVKYRLLILNLIRACGKEKTIVGTKTSNASLQRYHDCFNLVLTNLQKMSLRYRCMSDVMDLVYSVGPQSRPKENVMVAAQRLKEFTMTLQPKLPTHGIDEEEVDLEMNTISEFMTDVSKENINWFTHRYCSIPSHRYWTLPILTVDYNNKKLRQQIPAETTLVQFLENIINGYVDDLFTSWFYNLGFAYDETGNVTIRNN